MENKIVGIVSSRTKFEERFRMGSFRTYVASDYIDAVNKAGATPIIIPLINNEDKLREIVKLCHGIIISGGDDINPFLYGEEATPAQGMIDALRDRVDYIIIEECIKENKGILGICRGMQILNIYFGGTLSQDIDSKIAHVQRSDKDIPTHKININNGTILYDVFGESTVVNSFHHQSIDKLGEGIEISALALDNIIEGIEFKNNNKIYGVQFHPEMMNNSESMENLFKDFIKRI